MLARIDLRGRRDAVLVRHVGLAGRLRVTVCADDDMAAFRNAPTAALEETR